jgi:osmotically-inducible protein OsmY
MRRILAMALIAVLPFGPMLTHSHAEEGQAESIGKRLDRGLEQIGEKLKKAWQDAKQSVDELGIQGRVYARLRWDKALADQKIDIQVQKKDVVVLTGMVPDEAALEVALQLAQDTIGVREVVSQLQVHPQPATENDTLKIDRPD